MNLAYCPFCLSAVRDEICPHCGKSVNYTGDLMHLQVGYMLNGTHPYILGASLGQGGFGITYIALDIITNQRVAVKEYFPTYCAGRSSSVTVASYRGQEDTFQKGKERFLDEARMLKSLSDLDSVVNVLDFFEENNTAYLVMEYLDGISMKDYVENRGRMSAPWILHQMIPLMEDMEQMHNRGVVHRDIAPDNIIMLRGSGKLVLIDFGAARSYLGDKSMTIVVKKGFAPVEQYMRKGSNASTDIYALAATIYYCITGVAPPDSAERQCGEAQLVAPTRLGAELSPAQEEALERALAIQPRERTQSVAQVLEELKAAKRGAVSPSVAPTQKQYLRENKTGNKTSERRNKVTFRSGAQKQAPEEKREKKNTVKVKWPVMMVAAMLVLASVAVLVTVVMRSRPEERTAISNINHLETAEIITEDKIDRNPTQPTPVPEHVVSTATILSTGDILMHKPVIDSGFQNGTYDYESIFRYLKEDVTAADYAVANLETTLASTTNGYQYAGYPNFNCPDEIVDAARDAGFDMLLNGNNHSYDTSFVGAHRTISIIRDRGLDYTGFADTEEEKPYLVKEINGIHIGMICYTYETDNRADTVALNGLPLKAEDKNLVNVFDYAALDTFYADLEANLAAMEEDGAEATMLYIHWGNEYELQANDIQKKMAQKICDLGVDVIVGGHPHVVQPMDLLESTVDPDHKTVCLYSMGNTVSNQRQGNLIAIATAHTEDGVLFSVTFSKYSDGTVHVESTDLLPIWVYRRNNKTGNEFNILPLHRDRAEHWSEDFNMSDPAAMDSYIRTMAIVEEGLTECQTWLQESYEAREQYYYDLAFNPEKFATEATEAPTEAATEAAIENTAETTAN